MLLSIPFTISACFLQPVDKFYCSSVGSNPATAMVKMGGTYQLINISRTPIIEKNFIKVGNISTCLTQPMLACLTECNSLFCSPIMKSYL